MLLGIDPLLGGDLLKLLDDMGHGDTLVLCDRNFPAASTGLPVIRLGEVSLERAASAILSVLPLDTFVEHPLARMEANRDPDATTEASDALLELARSAGGRALEYEVIPRFDFYKRAARAFAVVHTLDARPYGDFLITKGVV